MSHTLRFAMDHPRYTNKIVLARIPGTKLWETKYYTAESAEPYQTLRQPRIWVRWSLDVVRATYRNERDRLERRDA